MIGWMSFSWYMVLEIKLGLPASEREKEEHIVRNTQCEIYSKKF